MHTAPPRARPPRRRGGGYRVGLALLIGTGACSAGREGGKGGGADATTAAVAPSAGLEGSWWRLLQSYDADAVTPATDGVRSALRFADGGMTGTGGCNRLSAPYRAVGDSLTLQAVASTQMSCGESADLQERRVVGALSRVRRYARRGDTLDLLGEGGEALLRLVVEPPRPLVGTTWNATGINNGTGGVASLVEGSAVTARFAPDGRLAGSAGCNRYTAPFTLASGDSLALGAGAATKRLCPLPGLMRQEQQFLATFPQVARYVIEHGVLEWRSASGALLARFAAQP